MRQQTRTSQPSENSSLPIVPPGSPAWVTAELLGKTLRVMQSYYPDVLTTEDGLEIITNVGRLFDVLEEKKQ